MTLRRPGPERTWRFAAAFAGGLAVLVGGLALVGWALDIVVLKSIQPGWVSMKPNVALAFVLMGLGLFFAFPERSVVSLFNSRLFPLLAGLIGLLTLGEYAFDWNPGLDQWLFREPAGAVETSHAGRMAPNTAFCFVLLATAWSLAGQKRRRAMLAAVVLGSAVAILGLLALVSSITPGLGTYRWWGLTAMAVPTAVTLVGLAAAVVSRARWAAMGTRGRELTLFSTHLRWMRVCVGALAITFTLYIRSEKVTNHAHEHRYRSVLLADELRQSSDDLTRMVRTYVVTGDPAYRQRFQDILDIRDGKKARPEDYWRPYWDLVLRDGTAPRGSHQATPLIEMMRHAGFSEEELRVLEQAQQNSDALTILELEAMRLVESAGPEAEANRDQARRMMFDEEYYQAKAAVMAPIDDFFVLVDKRTLAAVHAAANSASIFRWLSAAFGLGLVFVLWRGYVVLSGTLGGGLDEVHARIAMIGSGNFSVTIKAKPGSESSVLGWLSETQAKLKGLDRERREARENIEKTNASLEQRVRDRTAELESSNQELEAFSYSVSHDLRAPLRHVNGFVELLQKHEGPSLDEKSQRYLKTISNAAGKMGILIDDLLSFSHTGRTEMKSVTLSMSALVAGVRQDLEVEEQGRSIVWNVQPLPEADGDIALVRQVWTNLLSNAVKYTKNQPEARIEVGTISVNRLGTAYYVRDNGVGFDMRYVDKLFQVFQRLHTTHEFEGTGIGLANVKRIVTRHGGTTWAEGKVGEGAAFYFTLAPSEETTT